MTIAANSYRQKLLLAAACGLVAATAAPLARAADTSQQTTSPTGVNLGLGQAATATQSESVIVKAQRRLLKEKNSPSAVTELGAKQIAATGVSGSPATLLRQAPSVYVYSQGIGDNAPELTVRGLRGLEIASTLDGVPTQDLLAPDSFYLANNLGGVFTLNQISGVSIYPGVAYPDKNTFGTIGGTIAYESKRPTDDAYIDVTGSAGSFGTYKEGIELNSGSTDSVLGTGDNAIKVMANYYNLQTQGFIDGTPNRENEFMTAFDKPYDDGLSKVQGTIIYNQAIGLIQNEPVPLPYLEKYGTFSNYPTNLDFAQQRNDYVTAILKDDTYINDYVNVGLTGFYIHNDEQLENYGAPELFLPTPAHGCAQTPLTVNCASPFVNNAAGFGLPTYLFGPPTPPPLGLFGGGSGGYYYSKFGNAYNPFAVYPTGSPGCSSSYVAQWGGRANTPCGLNDQITGSSSDTYGLQPRAVITPPDIFGISNTIKIGGLFAKETEPEGYAYLGGLPQSMNADNAGGFGGTQSSRTGGVQRTIYQGYAQDKIDFLDNTLHVTPGITIEGTKSSYLNQYAFASHNAPAYGPNGYFSGLGAADQIDQYGYYKATKWDREYLPFANVSYDFDKVYAPLAGLSVYGSFGNSALFAPVTDFGPNTAGPPPGASIVHMYEGGIKYDTSVLLLSADYFYQKVDRDFGYFSFQSGPQNGLAEYSGFGQRETKGVEATVTWQVTPDIQLFGNMSHLLAKYLTSGFSLDTVAEDQYGIQFKDSPETGIPDWLSNFGLDYSRKSLLLDGDAFEFRPSGTYTGHQYTTYDLSGDAYLSPAINFPGLLPLTYGGCPGPAPAGGNTSGNSCAAYTRYNQITGATTYDPNGGISPFVIFNIDLNYKLPTPELPVVKYITFDLNAVNIFNRTYWQYFYKQVSPANCGTFTSGPFTGLAKNNYSCTPEFADAIPGQPASVFFTVTARF
jgi:iron complex outermembrane recepter protein